MCPYFVLDVGYPLNSYTYAYQAVASGFANTDTFIDAIPPNDIYPSPNTLGVFRFEPVTWMWADCPNDSSVWNVTVFDPTNQNDSSSVRIVWRCVTPTSIEESSKTKNIKAFPNPANSILNFNSKTTGRLYNVLGCEVLFFRDMKEIDISHLTKGVYFLKTKNSTQKILKQ